VAAEVQVTQGYTWTEEMGIVIACLIEDEKTHLINWVKEVSLPDLPSSDLVSRSLKGTFRDNIPEEIHHRRDRQGWIRR